ncbi:hypothetical protein [Paenibacillus ginsengihumi]|uniref:hypothetical protein n=1 Tax=Paenibacillus ginsengihumi TaxID=431596 RepID=UPI00037D6447|nr:hypothetical protein [Paenibacillus ginsengihumi]
MRNLRSAMLRFGRSWLVMVLALVLLGSPLAAPAAQAGKQGVFLNASVYFTLEEAVYSAGAGDAALRFTLRLHNGGGSSVDFNRYGVRVADAPGSSYAAQLLSRQTARVEPGQSQDFRFLSQLSGSPDARGLKVTIFEWDLSLANFMKDIGSLNVAPALGEAGRPVQETALQLKKADASLPDDSTVIFRPERAYPVFEGNTMQLYVELLAENAGNTSLSLPDGLKYRLTDKSGQQYAATVVYGADQPLLPGKSRKLTLRSALPGAPSADGGLKLQLYTAAVAGAEEWVAGTFALADLLQPRKVRESAAYLLDDGSDGLTVKLDSATLSATGDEATVRARVALSNDTSRAVAVPALVASFQTRSGEAQAQATDTSAHPSFLSPGETASYYFQAVLPKAATEDDVQLALLENKAAGGTETAAGGLQLPLFVADLAGASAYGGDSGMIVGYQYGQPLHLPVGGIVEENLEVVLADLRLYENESTGYPTAVAKFKLTNRGDRSLPLPEWTTELVAPNGQIFSGVAKAAEGQTIAPNTSAMVMHSYMLGTSDVGDSFMMRVTDETSAAAKKLTIASFPISLRTDEGLENSETMNFYPFAMRIKDFNVYTTYGSSTYSYTMKMENMAQWQEPLVVDANAVKAHFELLDEYENVIATTDVPFIGAEKLANGKNQVVFSGIRFDWLGSRNHVKMYELLETPSGTVKRFLKQLN